MVENEIDIPEKWIKTTLGDILDLKNGYAFKSETYSPSGIYNVITIKNVQGKRFISLDSVDKVNELPPNLASHQHLKPYDILVSLTGNNGRVSYNTGENNLLNQRVGLLEILDANNVDREFVFQLLSSPMFRTTMETLGEGAAQKNLKKEHIMDYEILLPPLPEQERIASILGDLDDLIEKQAKFIDKKKRFRDGIIEKMMFNDDYPMTTFEEECRYIRGITYDKNQELPGDENIGIPVFRSNNIDIEFSRLTFDNTKHVSRDVVVADQQWLRKGDIMITAANGSARHIGKVALIPEDMDYTFGGFMAVIRTTARLDSRFMFYLLRSRNFRDFLDEKLSATTIRNLKAELLNPFEFGLPDMEKQKKIADILQALDDELFAMQQHLNKVAAMKTALLRQLITGEIRVA